MKREIPFSLGLAIVLGVGVLAFMAEANPSSFLAAFKPPVFQLPEFQLPESVTVVTPQAMRETAIVQMAAQVAAQTAAQTLVQTLSQTPITPGLLPQVRLVPPPAASASKKSKSTATTATTATAATKTTAPAATRATVATAQSFLNATAVSFKQTSDGPYEIVLTTTVGGSAGTPVTWGLDKTTVSSFSVSYSCNPALNPPLAGASDQNPTFGVQTSYDCTIALTPTTGNDRATKSKDFSFTTPAGELSVTPPRAMGTVLHNGENDGGFVFNNSSAEAVTITGLTLDISYTALNVAAGPLVLRPIDPISGVPYSDYHLENLAVDPSVPYTHTGTGIVIPVSFTVKPAQQKMFPLEILGVSVMGVAGASPAMTITLRDITTDGASGVKVSQNAPKISWSCIVPLTGYDPNATSGPYATGEACR